MAEPIRYIGLDRNLHNVTIATSDVETKTYDLSECENQIDLQGCKAPL